MQSEMTPLLLYHLKLSHLFFPPRLVTRDLILCIPIKIISSFRVDMFEPVSSDCSTITTVLFCSVKLVTDGYRRPLKDGF